jgi:type IV secretory pathway VirB10-like protein
MLSNRLAFAALAVACIAAAAGGGYLASRQNAVPAPAAAQAQPTTAAPAAQPMTAERPVQETEAVVAESKSPAKNDAPKIAPTKRAEKAPARAAATQQQPPPLASTWPSSAAGSQSTAASTPSAAVAPEQPAAPKPEEHAAQTPPPAPEPPPKQFEELVVARDSVIGLQTENRISSDTAHVEDRVEARVTRDVRVADRVAIPAGAHAIGAVTLVERGGKFKERARLGIRFHTLVLADGTRVPMNTETIFREGDAPGNSSAAKIGGGAVGGAIIGAILGGAKGAAIGATTGAGAGTAVVAAGDRSTVVLQPGTQLTVRVQQPVTMTVEKE